MTLIIAKQQSTYVSVWADTLISGLTVPVHNTKVFRAHGIEWAASGSDSAISYFRSLSLARMGPKDTFEEWYIGEMLPRKVSLREAMSGEPDMSLVAVCSGRLYDLTDIYGPRPARRNENVCIGAGAPFAYGAIAGACWMSDWDDWPSEDDFPFSMTWLFETVSRMEPSVGREYEEFSIV